jgi:tRNA 2-selenouridine synthase
MILPVNYSLIRPEKHLLQNTVHANDGQQGELVRCNFEKRASTIVCGIEILSDALNCRLQDNPHTLTRHTSGYSVRSTGLASIEQLQEFDVIIDVRTPSEFAEDHIPGALNFPVLSDEERVRVGTLHKQSSFEAKKIGAALIARNIADHIENNWLDRPRSWHPLVYCWRGGQRSGAMTHILRTIGFAAERLEGGYKGYRHHVLEQLEIIPATLSYIVLCGLTGSGKSLLLTALKQAGAQVLDLEEIAKHRGSVLGDMPDMPQPAQKGFDSQLLALIHRMWESPCVRLETSTALRVALLRQEYQHFLDHPALLQQQLDRLRGIYSNEQLAKWQTQYTEHRWDEFVAELLTLHYDPAYTKSIYSHYPDYEKAPQLCLNSLDNQSFQALAKEALALHQNFVNNDNKIIQESS